MRRYTLDVGGKAYVIDVQDLAADSFEVVVGAETYVVTLTGDETLADAAITPELVPVRAPGATVERSGAAPVRAAPAATPAGGTPGATGGAAVTARSARKGVVPSAAPQPRKPVAAGASSINAPMPGVIIELGVKVGDTVTRGQQIAVLDAMKMHNSIRSPRDGKIHEVCVDAGQAVGHGDPIVRFEES